MLGCAVFFSKQKCWYYSSQQGPQILGGAFRKSENRTRSFKNHNRSAEGCSGVLPWTFTNVNWKLLLECLAPAQRRKWHIQLHLHAKLVSSFPVFFCVVLWSSLYASLVSLLGRGREEGDFKLISKRQRAFNIPFPFLMQFTQIARTNGFNGASLKQISVPDIASHFRSLSYFSHKKYLTSYLAASKIWSSHSFPLVTVLSPHLPFNCPIHLRLAIWVTHFHLFLFRTSSASVSNSFRCPLILSICLILFLPLGRFNTISAHITVVVTRFTSLFLTLPYRRNHLFSILFYAVVTFMTAHTTSSHPWSWSPFTKWI